MSGFHVDSVTDVPDVRGRLWRMTYEKNGAELVWLEREDEVKTFAITFKTLPEDDTGVAHILEHTVLEGSEKYPVKSPFGELRKSSLCVFLNAATGRDKTSYPFCTRNDQDFLNLADVYLDAVFHPNAVKDPTAFLQEGWHYDIDEKTDALSCNGVVYNEMKGVFANPERVIVRDVMRYLYPDIVYGRDSGGRPDAIPNLTYAQFCAFYKRHYHPSNARIFLDGNVDLPAALAKLDAYLSAFDRAEKVAPIPVQQPVLKCATLPYPSSDCVRKTFLVDAWNVGDFRDRDRRAALGVITSYLAGSNEAPLTKALLEQGLCDDLSLFLVGSFQQVPMVMIVRNTTDEQAAQCRAVIRRTLARVLEDGLDRKRLEAIISCAEFSDRALDTSCPRGLVFFDLALSTWLYGDDPSDAFNVTDAYRRLRAGVSDGLIEKLLKEVFLDESRHHVELTYTPSKTLGEEKARQWADELARRRAAMSDQDVAALKRQLASLAEYQKRDDSQAAKECVPSLRVCDIPTQSRMLEHEISTDGGVTLIRTRSTSEGIVYASVYFPIDGLTPEELVKVPLLVCLLEELPTSVHGIWSLQTEIMSRIGGMAVGTAATRRGNYIFVEFSVLAEKDAAAVDLLREIIHETVFEDIRAIAKIYEQKKHAEEQSVVTRGDDLAESYAAGGLSRQWASRDVLHGYGQLRWLQRVTVDEAFAQSLAALARKVFVNDGLVISVTDNISETAEGMLRAIAPRGDGAMRVPADVAVGGRGVAGVRIDGDVGYLGMATLLPSGVFTGVMGVAAKVISREYLHKEIREIGGAYGTALSIRASGLVSCYTYRDPTPVASIETIRRAGEWLHRFAKARPKLDRYIIATVAGLDSYQSPSEEARFPMKMYLAKRSVADKERIRQQILSTKPEDLASVADVLQSVLPHAQAFVVGGKSQVAPLPGDRIEPLNLK